jgi:hypothetical protein
MYPDSDPDSDPDADPAIFAIDLQNANKKLIIFYNFLAYGFLMVYLHHFSKIKSQKKKHKIVGIKVFLTIFE